jgi:uncharacterized protein (TIGR02271 family)
MAQTVVGLFEDRDHAEKAVRKLMEDGVPSSDISVVTGDPEGRYKNYKVDDRGNMAGEGAATGAGTGAVVGGIIGLLVGAGTIVFPVAGLVAAGPIAGLLTGAGAGAVTGGIIGALVGLGIPKEDAETYAEAVRRGDVLVAVECDESRADRVADILDSNGAVDVEERREQFRTEGTRYDPNAKPYTEDEIRRHRETTRTNRPAATANTGDKIEVVKEDLTVGKREVGGGGVRIKKYVTERPVRQQVELREEHVNVERRPVDRPASEQDFAGFKEDVIEVKERSEEAVVGKTARVVEEISVNKTSDTRTETVEDTVRETHVDVEKINAQHGSAFREDYGKRYNESRDGAYDQFEPAYHYGAACAMDRRFQNKDWNQAEPEIRREWESKNPGTWNKFRDAVKSGWERESSRVGNNRAQMM